MPPPSVPLDAIRLSAALFDTDGRVAAVNELAGAMAGRPVVGLSAADLSAHFDVRLPDGAPVGDAGSMVARVLGGGMVLDLPVAITLPDGRRLDTLATASPIREGGVVPGALEISGVPFFDADGTLLGYRGTTRDVTEQKRAEKALLESEERLRLAQESAGIAIWDRDAATDRVIIAPGFIRRYLLDPAGMVSYEDWGRNIHPDDRGRAESERQRALAAGEPLDLDFRIVIPSGEIRWLQLKGRGMRDERGVLARVLGVIIDVTERKRAEEALRESEADARSFFSNMVDACAICEVAVDERGEPVDIRLVDVNPAFERALSLPADLIVGQTAFMILPTLHREWLDLFLEVSRNRAFVAVEEPFPTLDHRYHVTGFPVRHGRVAVVFRDITGQRDA